MGTGQKRWTRAKKVIPGGNMLLSKRAEMHLPGKWPSYFSKTDGCCVWDLDGNKFVDTYYMGVGTNILGYSHPVVDEAVKKVISMGNMSTLNAPEEVWLAERLLEINPWAGGVRSPALRRSERCCNKNCKSHVWKRRGSRMWLSRLA